MKKRILSLILVAVMLFGMTPMTLLTAFADDVIDAIDNTPKVSITPETVHDEYNNYAKPDASGYAHFMVTADTELKGDTRITVKYETRDLSAVAESGDYYEASGTIVLTAENPDHKIVIKTQRTEYAVTHVNMQKNNSTSYLTYESRKFEVVLTDVSGDGKKDEAKCSAQCALNAENSLIAMRYVGATRAIFAPYTRADKKTYGGQYMLPNFLVTPKWSDESKAYVKTVKAEFPIDEWSKYLYSAIDADVYMAMNNAHVDESWWNSSTSIEVTVGPARVFLNGEFHDNEDFGWGPAFAYVLGGYEGKDGRYKSYFEDNFFELQWAPEKNYTLVLLSGMDGERGEDGLNFLSEKDIEMAYKNKWVIVREYFGYGEVLSRPAPEDYWIRINDSKTGFLYEPDIEIRFWINGGFSRRLTSGDVVFRLEDLKAPVMEKNGNSYSVYNNFDTVHEGEKLRLMLRFNEPVQVTGQNPFITGQVNGRGTGTLTDPYTIRFDYAGGSGTDTLYFESEYSGNYNITSITNLIFTYDESISDYAGVRNNLDAPKFNISGFSVDRRDPYISVDNATYVGNSNPCKSSSMEVTVSQISNGATLYYTWTDRDDLTPEEIASLSYDNETVLNNVSINGTQTVNINGSGDGKKFLYLKAVTWYGKVSTVVMNSKTGLTKNCLGPFYFDNSPPTFENTVIPIAEESDMAKKVYEISLPVDNPNGAASGFYDMHIYYVMPDGSVNVVKRENILAPHQDGKYDADAIIPKDFASGNLKITLEAADIGIGEKTRVENIAIYFVLTDNLGNIATDVSKHTVVFDTNEYIEVNSKGPSEKYKDETEKLDGENTYIYNNNKITESLGKTVYFSFELGIKEYAAACKNLFKVIKVGEGGNASTVLTKGYTERTVDGENGEKTLILEFTSPIISGCYDIQLQCFDSDNPNMDKPDRVSDVYRVYIGSGAGKLGDKINDGTVLINKVYQLPASSSFYYMDRSEDGESFDVVSSVLTEYYNKDRLPMSFSSYDQARKYVLFNEYRDLYAITLTDALADALNNKTTSVHPAQGETTYAQAGQVWIRYKSVSWTVGSKQASHWVYYYYGNSEVLNPDNFSAPLNEALGTVADMITNSGRTVALTDLSLKNNSGSTLLDKNGAPYLAPSQIVTSDLYITDSTTKISTFSKEIKYSADTAIYSSKVVMNNTAALGEYVLIGNVSVPLGSRFQYRKYNSLGSGYVSDKWVDVVLTSQSGTERFSEVIAEDGWYELRELGVNGTNVYNVCIDKKSPLISIAWNDKDDKLHNMWLSAESERDFRARSIEITGIDNFEADKYSYVAIYHMMSSELYGVYTANDLQNTSVLLPDGRYYMIVADRSGNSYYMSLYINSTGMNCNVEQTPNVRIKFTCDRDSSQIQTFYVKRNGIRIDGVQYANTVTFTESGAYEFYVEDIYGNTFGPYTESFEREYPEIDWSYQEKDGYFTKYVEGQEASGFNLHKITDGSFRITSSVQMRFHITGDYGYEFIGTAPEITKNDIQGYVTITSAQSFQLKVYYRDHPEVYTVYNCASDKNAPTINVSAQVQEFSPAEIDLLKEAIKEATLNGSAIGVPGTILDGGVTVSGSFLTPSTLAFLAGTTQNKFLTDGETTLSDFISVNAKDINGILSLEIYLDGKLLNRQTSDNGISDVILSRYGEYRIVAMDKLGNASEFSFKNARPDAFRYTVDGEDIELGIHDNESFDENLNYTAVNYGNASVSFELLEQMKVFYFITDSKGETRFVAFDVDGQTVRSLHYFLRDGMSTPELLTADVLFNAKNADKNGKEYLIYENGGASVFAKVNAEGNIELKVYSQNNGVITVEARLSNSDGEFYYNKTELSKLPFNLSFNLDGNVRNDFITVGQNNINKPFLIVANANIKAIEVYFSKLNDIDVNDLGIRDNIYGNIAYTDEGFYLVKAEDKYGNERIYRIHLSDDFEVTSYVELSGDEKLHYSAEYKKVLYSDTKIVFELHSDKVTVVAKKDGKTYIPLTDYQDGITYVTVTESGEYTFSFSDAYGNTVNYTAKIDTSIAEFNEQLLTGYNENALRRDEGYTNLKLSIAKGELADIYYLAIRYGNELTVIYDALSENEVAINDALLKECIGKAGDGEYTVTVRNRYGSIATKVIHYRSTPTLKLERETRSNTMPESYSLEDALSIGFWSNSTLSFSTDAIVYSFKINKDNSECPKTLSYKNSAQYGKIEYEISYIDEYGFSYSFKAYLVRQDVEISLPDDLIAEDINDVLTTRDDISVIFSENAFCTYTLNNSDAKVYTPGEKLRADGVYRFTVFDYAGNVSALTVKKDTAVEFYFKTNKSASIQNGEVVNYSKVEFNEYNGDTAYIEKVLKNGVIQNGFSGSTFSEDGKWEVIVADKLGNRSYFCFYIISRAQNGFAYTTPYEYRITEALYDSGDGVKISYMSFINHEDHTSSFDFTENGHYIISMMSDLTGVISTFEFTVNTNSPDAYLVGCNEGETTINDITLAGLNVGDTIKIYKSTDMGETLVKEVEVSSTETLIPVITEGGEYRVVVESESGVASEFNFVRKHVMNTSGSVFIMILIGVATVGLFAGLVYRNKSKTDD